MATSFALMGTALVAACGDPEPSATIPSDDGGMTARDAGSPGNEGGTPPDDGGAGDGGGPGPGPGCTRAVQAKAAHVALWDTFKTDIASLTDAARAARIDRLFADVASGGGTPLEDPGSDRVVFLARGASPSGTWMVTGGFSSWDKASAPTLTQVPGTDVYAVELTIPRTESHEYKLLTARDDAGFVPDPLAKHVAWDGVDRGFGVAGEFNGVVHPGALPASKGRLVSMGKVHATRLANDRPVWTYYPPRYDDGSCASLPSVVIHDGLESLTRGGFSRVADTLYASQPALSAVLVFVGLPSQDVRMAEYSFGASSKGEAYVDFLTSDLWPKVTAGAHLCSKQGARGISGASLGGLISTFAAFEKPTIWGWVGAQSASYFWGDGAMITRVSQTPRLDVRFYLDSGCPEDNCAVTDQMDAALTAKGYDHVRIKEEGAAHDWRFWRDRLAGMLTHFRQGQTVCD